MLTAPAAAADLESRWTEFEDRLHALGRTVIAPRVDQIDADGTYPEDLFRALAENGLLRLSLPPDLGGPDPAREPAGLRALMTATRVLSQYCSAVGLMLLLSRLPAAPILLAGTDRQRRERLIGLGRGEQRGAFCLSEPQAGSDVLALTTSAERTDDGWRISGTKAWISGAAEADWFVVVATVDTPAQRRPDALRAFVIDRNTPGLTVSALHDRPAVRGMSLGDLTLDAVHVPDSARLPGITGVGPLLQGLATMRPVISARGLGLAEAALMLAVEYAESRHINARPLIRQQGIQWQIARAAADVEAARLLVRQAADLVDAGRSGPDVAAQLSAAKLHATECAVRVSGLATQIFGAAGCVTGHPAERMYRDARSLTVVEGTSEVQLGIIARAVVDRKLWWRSENGPH